MVQRRKGLLEVRRISDDQERCFIDEGAVSTVGELRDVVSAHFALDLRRTTLIPSAGGGGWPLSENSATLEACGITPEAHAYVVDRDVDVGARRPTSLPAAVAAQQQPATVVDPETVYVWTHKKMAAWKGRSASKMGMKLKSFFEVFYQCEIKDGGFDSREGWATFVFANEGGRTRALQLNELLTLPNEEDIMAISEELPPAAAEIPRSDTALGSSSQPTTMCASAHDPFAPKIGATTAAAGKVASVSVIANVRSLVERAVQSVSTPLTPSAAPFIPRPKSEIGRPFPFFNPKNRRAQRDRTFGPNDVRSLACKAANVGVDGKLDALASKPTLAKTKKKKTTTKKKATAKKTATKKTTKKKTTAALSLAQREKIERREKKRLLNQPSQFKLD